ncbi:hypothetical protein QTN47_18160 [Danxiaibacter flavus]|uniref:Uncharacterized protein n=1 Tax=Danxiaibacter flavus TaxID=3049108 RepID=A0ABV3ZHV1_9BACT|nr:hypothetical protein QNM32_18170 [Chitinophagaceae bacterium DXS]
MKKKVAILLLIIYVFGATDANQLLKLPALVSHYIQHQHTTPGITLAMFIKLHYEDEALKDLDQDFQQDMRLPFKTHEADCCLTMPVLVPQPIKVAAHTPERPCVQYNISNDDVPQYLIPVSIFQPPRI